MTGRRGAFTMVELLCLLLMLALFAAMCPALIRARDSAAPNGCLDNLRRLGRLADLHAAEHDGQAVPFYDGKEPVAFPDRKVQAFWFARLLLYSEYPTHAAVAEAAERGAGLPGMACPSGPGELRAMKVFTAAPRPHTNYLYNLNLGFRKENGDFAKTRSGRSARFHPRDAYTNPETLVVLVDGRAKTLDAVGLDAKTRAHAAQQVDARHDGRFQSLYLDGHADVGTAADFTDAAAARQLGFDGQP